MRIPPQTQRAGQDVPLRRGVAYAAIALVACAVYANSLSNGLVCDDMQVIPGNPLVEHPGDVWSIITGPYRIGQQAIIGMAYRPLTVWSFGVNYAVNGLLGLPGIRAAGYHILNVVLHAATCVLVFVLLAELGLDAWAALAAALLFAVHPIHTESVTAVVNRSEVLAALFGLLFLILHRRRAPAWACAISLLLAMWGKESAIAFFPLALVMDALFPHPVSRRPLAAYGWYLATTVVWLALWHSVMRHNPEVQVTPFMDNPLVAATVAQRLYTAAHIHLHYLWLQLVPVGLSSDYSYNQFPTIMHAGDPWVLGGVIVVALGAVAAWTFRRTHPVVSFALLGYPLLFAVTCNVVVVIGCTAERHVYGPSIMWCALCGYGAWKLIQRRGLPVAAAFCLVLAVYGGLTIARNRTWANELVLFRAQAASAPNSVRAHYNYGTVLVKIGDNAGAVPELEKAYAIYPDHPDISYNLGNALRVSGAAPERVIAAYRNAIRVDPGNLSALSNLAVYLTGLGRKREARPLVEAIARLNPRYHSLPLLYRRLGMRE
jgi:hypothetical protein